MRAEVEQAYRDGGGVTTVDEILEDITPDPMPQTKPTGTRELIDIHREQQLQKLKGGQERIAARRAEMQKKDEQARWFALAQGMLSPTKTGGFGESLGTTAGLLRQEQELARQGTGDLLKEEMLLAGQEADVGSDYIAQLQAQERIERPSASGRYQSGRTPVGIPGLFPHPDDPNRDMRAQEVWDADKEVPQFNDDGTPMLDENGQPVIKLGAPELVPLAVGPDGSIPYATSQYDVERQMHLSQVKGFTDAQITRVSNDIEGARDAWKIIPNMERTLALMKDRRNAPGTGGWVALVQGMQEWFGVDTQGVTDLGVLRNKLGQAVLLGLKHFPGQISEGERKYMESLEMSLSKPAGVNIALLEDGLRIQTERWKRGRDSALEVSERAPLIADLMGLDLKAMGIDPANPTASPIGSFDTVQRNEPGSSKQNPIDWADLKDAPPVGTWVTLPSGEVRKYRGAQ